MGELADLGMLLERLRGLPEGRLIETRGRFAICTAIGSGSKPTKRDISPKIAFSGDIQLRRTSWGYEVHSEGSEHKFSTKIISDGKWALVQEDPNLQVRSTQGWNRPYISTETPEFGQNAETRLYANFP